MRTNGEFILLKDGVAICYAFDYPTVRTRLVNEFESDPAREYCIVQVMATVPKPKAPTIKSIYEPPSV